MDNYIDKFTVLILINKSLCTLVYLFVSYYSIEMLDRTEAPTIQDGYGIAVAYACLMEIIRSIAISVEGAEYFR